MLNFKKKTMNNKMELILQVTIYKSQGIPKTIIRLTLNGITTPNEIIIYIYIHTHINQKKNERKLIEMKIFKPISIRRPPNCETRQERRRRGTEETEMEVIRGKVHGDTCKACKWFGVLTLAISLHNNR